MALGISLCHYCSVLYNRGGTFLYCRAARFGLAAHLLSFLKSVRTCDTRKCQHPRCREQAGVNWRHGVICFFVEFCQRFVGLADAGFGECGD